MATVEDVSRRDPTGRVRQELLTQDPERIGVVGSVGVVDVAIVYAKIVGGVIRRARTVSSGGHRRGIPSVGRGRGVPRVARGISGGGRGGTNRGRVPVGSVVVGRLRLVVDVEATLDGVITPLTVATRTTKVARNRTTLGPGERADATGRTVITHGGVGLSTTLDENRVDVRRAAADELRTTSDELRA